VEKLPDAYSPLDPGLGLGDTLSVSPKLRNATQIFSINHGLVTPITEVPLPPRIALTGPFSPVTKECSPRESGTIQGTEVSTTMDQIIQQVGALFVGAIPTLILFILLVLAYQFLVQGPLTKTLEQRKARTSGAVEEAARAIAAAEAKTADYANKLRQARAEVFHIREQRLHQWAQERDAALEVSRKAAGARVQQAKAAIEAEVGVARQTLVAGADKLAEQVVRALLPAAAGGFR